MNSHDLGFGTSSKWIFLIERKIHSLHTRFTTSKTPGQTVGDVSPLGLVPGSLTVQNWGFLKNLDSFRDDSDQHFFLRLDYNSRPRSSCSFVRDDLETSLTTLTRLLWSELRPCAWTLRVGSGSTTLMLAVFQRVASFSKTSKKHHISVTADDTTGVSWVPQKDFQRVFHKLVATPLMNPGSCQSSDTEKGRSEKVFLLNVSPTWTEERFKMSDAGIKYPTR